MSKVCSKCGRNKSIAEFYVGMAKCKSCKKQYEKEYIRQNKDKVFKIKQRYRKDHAKELGLAKKVWRTKNKEQVAATLAEWYSKNIDRKKQYEKRICST